MDRLFNYRGFVIVVIVILVMSLYDIYKKFKKEYVSKKQRDTKKVSIKKYRWEIQFVEDLMDEDIFWNIIEELKDIENQKEYIYRITEKLISFWPKEIIWFELRVNKHMYELYSSHMWCAWHIILWYSSENCFEDFKWRIVSLWKERFYKSVKKSDSLIEVVQTSKELYGFWEFLFVARDAFELKTWKDIHNYINSNHKYYEENYPKIEFDRSVDNSLSMKKICPMLYKEFIW